MAWTLRRSDIYEVSLDDAPFSINPDEVALAITHSCSVVLPFEALLTVVL
jgi:hypothetical protein